MKKRLTRKLFLSLAAMGVTAATLTTSTFAWYTANAEAKVSTITAETETAGADSLFISMANAYLNGATTGQKATGWDDYLATATPHLTGTTTNLKPVYSNFATWPVKAATTGENATEAVTGRSYNQFGESTANYTYAKTTDQSIDNSKTYYTKDGNVYTAVSSPVVASINDYYERGARQADSVTYQDEDTSSFLEFVFRVRTSKPIDSAKPLYFSAFNITSTATSGATTQIALASGDGTGIQTTGLYGAKLVKALKLDVTSAAVSLGENNAIPAQGVLSRSTETAATATTPTTYGFEGLAGDTQNASTDTNISTANAVGYYNRVMGTNLVTPSNDYATEVAVNAANADTDVIVATLPKTETGKQFSVVEVRFVLYLDGWDNYCYDIMQNQTVNFDFKLSTEISSSVLKYKA